MPSYQLISVTYTCANIWQRCYSFQVRLDLTGHLSIMSWSDCIQRRFRGVLLSVWMQPKRCWRTVRAWWQHYLLRWRLCKSALAFLVNSYQLIVNWYLSKLEPFFESLETFFMRLSYVTVPLVESREQVNVDPRQRGCLAQWWRAAGLGRFPRHDLCSARGNAELWG